MVRKYIDISTAFTGLTPASRIEQLRTTLAEERAAYQSAQADSWDEHVIAKNIENLEDALDRAELNERLHAVLHKHRLREMDRYDELVAETTGRYRGML